MVVIINERQASEMLAAADSIYKLFAFAEGQEESHEARRAEWLSAQEESPFPRTLAGIVPQEKTGISESTQKEALPKKENREKSVFWKKFKKEISKMQKSLQEKIQKAIKANPRLHKGVYEKRAMIKGITIYGSSPNVDECESRFLIDLTEKIAELRAPGEGKPKKPKNTMLFSEWANIWFDQVFKPSVLPYTFNKELKQFQNHALPFFGGRKIREIAPLDCIQFFNGLKAKKIERTAESLYWKLSRIFNFAVESGLLDKSPMSTMKPIKHERENGKPLTKDEENALLAAIRGAKYEVAIVVALYTGLRPCEMETARMEGDFIVAQNRKQKNTQKTVFKKIPITPMLEPYRALIETTLPELTEKFSSCAYAKTFKDALPDHRLYDLRDTFATRCQECGVIEQAVQLFMGHVPRTLLGKVYTKFSDDFLLSEGKKVKY